MITPQQMDFPSMAFPKDRSVLTVGEVAARWEVSDRHVVDLIEEGKLVAFDIAGKRSYVRVPVDAIPQIAKSLGIKADTLLAALQNARATRPANVSGRAFYRVPVVEGYTAFMRENHSLLNPSK